MWLFIFLKKNAPTSGNCLDIFVVEYNRILYFVSFTSIKLKKENTIEKDYDYRLKRKKPKNKKRRKQVGNLVLVGLVTLLLQVRGLRWFYYSMILWKIEIDFIKCNDSGG